jgi:hypothetical protein
MMMNFWSLDPFFKQFSIEEVWNLFLNEFEWEEGSFDIIRGVFKDGSFNYYLDAPTDLDEDDIHQFVYRLLEKIS